MPDQTSKLTPLAARKRLLLMESQLNRARLEEAIQLWKGEVHSTKERLTHWGALASMAGKVATAVPTIGSLLFRRGGATGKSKTPFLLNSMMTGTSVWLLLRSFLKKS